MRPLPLRSLLLPGLFALLATSPAAEVTVYKPATAAGKPLSPNTFEIFNPANIPNPQHDPRPAFRAQLTYSARDWAVYSEPRSRGRMPADPTRYDRTVLSHRTVPAALAFSFEQVEAAADSDPLTLAKILRFNREAHARFRMLHESTRRIAGVEGAQAEYVQLRNKKLMRVRHWITHYNGVVCQLELLVPYEHPELLDLGGSHGFPLVLELFDPQRNRPVLKDADIPRTFASPYAYQVNLGEGEWIPGAHDPFISSAEYVAYTRNQGGIAVVPFSTLGQNLDPAALLNAMVWLGELPTAHMLAKPRRLLEGKLEGITFETLSGDEQEMIRMRAKAVCSATHAYLAVAWINTNAPLGPEVLEQWLNKVTFSQDAAPWPTNAQTLTGLREKDRQAMGFLNLGEHYFASNDFDRSAAALRTALECRFLPALLTAYARSEHRRGHPEEVVSYLKSRGPLALAQGWVAMELAYAESRCGDTGKAAAHYTQCIASGGYSVADFPPDCFEDYIRCLLKADRTAWASDRLKQRIALDPSPRWPRLLADLSQGRPAASPKAASPAPPAAAPVPSGPPQLRSIIWNPTAPSAQLDKTLALEGDRVRGYKVAKIHQDRVELLTPEGSSLTLRLKPSAP